MRRRTLVDDVEELRRGHVFAPQVVEPREYPWTAPGPDTPRWAPHPRHLPVIPDQPAPEPS